MSIAQDSLAIQHGLQVLVDPVEALKDEVLGQVITPESPEYDAARTLVAFSEQKTPAVIVKTKTTEDVATTVRFARAQQLPVAVRSGGHSIPGHSVSEGGIVLDLADMRAIDIDPGDRTAWAETGLTALEFSAA